MSANDDDEATVIDMRDSADRISELCVVMYRAILLDDCGVVLHACDRMRNAVQVISAGVVAIEESCRERDTIPAPEPKQENV